MMLNYSEYFISNSDTIEQALAKLNVLSENTVLFVINEQNQLLGSLTDGDIRRGLLNGKSINNDVLSISNRNPHFIYDKKYDIEQLISYREKNYKLIPVLDFQNKIVNIISFKETHSILPIDVIIMAGGKGQRLLPLTLTTPKPLLNVGGKPILLRNIDRLIKFGVSNIWISVNYLGEQIVEYFESLIDYSDKIRYIYEDKELGTIGAASNVKHFNHDYVLITNSDLLTNIDYENFFIDFINNNADFSVVAVPYEINVPYAIIESQNNRIISFKEKPNYTFYANAGIYLMKREIIDFIPINEHFNATDLIELLVKKGKNVISYNFLDYWLDIGKPEDFQKAQMDINKIKF